VNGLTELEKNTLTTWRATLMQEKHGNLAVMIMEITSFMALENIEPDFFAILVYNYPSITNSDLAETLDRLEKLSLITINVNNDDGSYIEIKPTIQLFIRNTVDNQESVITKAVELADIGIKWIGLGGILKNNNFLNHANAIAGFALEHDSVLKKYPMSPVKTALQLIYKEEAEIGLKLSERILQKYKVLFGINARETLEAGRCVVWAYHALNMYQEAVELLEVLYPTAKNILGDEDELTLTSAFSLALAFQNIEEYANAVTHYDTLIMYYKAVNDYKQQLRIEYLKGTCLAKMGDFKSALQILADTFELQVEHLDIREYVKIAHRMDLETVGSLILNG